VFRGPPPLPVFPSTLAIFLPERKPGGVQDLFPLSRRDSCDIQVPILLSTFVSFLARRQFPPSFFSRLSCTILPVPAKLCPVYFHSSYTPLLFPVKNNESGVFFSLGSFFFCVTRPSLIGALYLCCFEEPRLALHLFFSSFQVYGGLVGRHTGLIYLARSLLLFF